MRSVTSNTRTDGTDFLAHAAAHRVRVSVTPYPLSRADDALRDLAADALTGAAVLIPDWIGNRRTAGDVSSCNRPEHAPARGGDRW